MRHPQAEMRATIRLTGKLEPDDLSPAMREDLGEIYRRWRNDDQGQGDDGSR